MLSSGFIWRLVDVFIEVLQWKQLENIKICEFRPKQYLHLYLF